MMASMHEPRGTADGTRNRKQSMAELKLRRLQELVARLREDLDRRRIPVSEASIDLINYTKKEPKDFMVPSIWGYVSAVVRIYVGLEMTDRSQPARGEDPYAPQQSGGCCLIM